MAIVHAPNRSHSGLTAGVRFTAGVGETDNPAALAYFRRAGYRVEYAAAPPADAVAIEVVPDAYDGLTKKELLALAEQRGVHISLPASNAAIRDALIAAASAAEEAVAGSAVETPAEADPFAPGEAE